MNNKIKKILLFLAFAVLFSAFFNNYISAKVWDYDFWWHLATGRYIVESRTIPDIDPFSYVNNLEENQAVKNPLGMQFNLKQYWLAQTLFYVTYKTFGDTGIMIFRGIVLLATILLIFTSLKKRKVSYLVIFPLVFCVHMTMLYFIGERPVLFTILFSVITVYLLDEYKWNNSKLFIFLIPVMLLWANLHGGFILGIALIGIYMLGETVTYFLNREISDKHKLIRLYIVGLTAIAVSAVNPNGFRGFLALTPQYQTLFQSETQEYMSPFVLYRNKVSLINWWYIAMLLIFPLVIILRNRKMNITYYLLLGGLAYMSISSLRYVIFFVCIGAMILGRELDAALAEYSGKFDPLRSKLEPFLVAMIFGSSMLFGAAYIAPENIKFGKATRFSVPEGAVEFIQKNEIKGNMFNDIGFGGYLIWKLYPGKKVFHDTRALNYTVMREYGWIVKGVVSLQNKTLPAGKKPLWERLLDHYNADLIVLSTRDVFGSIPELTFSLLKSKEWVPVFYDGISMIFVREKKENREIIIKYKIAEESVYNMLIATYSKMAMDNKNNPYYMLTIGDIFYNMGKYGEALKAYEYTDKRLPDMEIVKEKIALTRNLLAVK